MDSKVSVIIPCYNAEHYIDIGIKSIFEQDYPNVELIIVNDGSTDKSEEIIRSWVEPFAQKGYELKYYCQTNQGQAAATNHALKHVTGEYLTLLDADDYFLPGSISKRVNYLISHPECSGVRTNGWMINGDNKQLFITSQQEKEITDMFSALILGQTNNWAGTYMVRTEVLFSFYADRSIYPSRFGQNMQILLPVAYGREFGYIDDPLMVYVIHQNSHSQAVSAEQQFQKDEINQEGYRDIYIHVMDAILTNPAEHKRYRNAFDAAYYRCGLFRAIKHQKHELIEERYQALKATGMVTLNDRIAYLNAKKSPIVFFPKVLRKLKSLSGR